MTGLFDSLPAILGGLVLGLSGIVAFLLRLFNNERQRRKEAEFQADQITAVAKARLQAQAALDEHAAGALAREDARVNEARSGRRDHFESDR